MKTGRWSLRIPPLVQMTRSTAVTSVSLLWLVPALPLLGCAAAVEVGVETPLESKLDMTRVWPRLLGYMQLSAADRDKIQKRIMDLRADPGPRKDWQILVKEDISRDLVATLETHAAELPGIDVVPTVSRPGSSGWEGLTGYVQSHVPETSRERAAVDGQGRHGWQLRLHPEWWGSARRRRIEPRGTHLAGKRRHDPEFRQPGRDFEWARLRLRVTGRRQHDPGDRSHEPRGTPPCWQSLGRRVGFGPLCGR